MINAVGKGTPDYVIFQCRIFISVFTDFYDIIPDSAGEISQCRVAFGKPDFLWSRGTVFCSATYFVYFNQLCDELSVVSA